MYLKKSTSKKTGRTYLSCVYGYRDTEGRSRTKTYKSFGYLDELKNRFKDPIAHFTQVVEELNKQDAIHQEVSASTRGERVQRGPRKVVTKNVGYIFPYHYYQKLGVESFWKNIQQKESVLYDLNAVFRLLTLLRALEPTQNSTNMYRKDMLFERTDFQLINIYDALSIFSKYYGRFINYLHKRLLDIYPPDLSIGFYYLIPIYLGLQSDELLEYRRLEQKQRRTPMFKNAFLTDRNGIPLNSWRLDKLKVRVNEHREELQQAMTENSLDKIITIEDLLVRNVADLRVIDAPNYGFILSQDVFHAKGEYRKWILDNNWTDELAGNKFKSRRIDHKVTLVDAEGNTREVSRQIKQVCIWSKEQAEQQRQVNQRTYNRDLAELNRLDWLDPDGERKLDTAQIEQDELLNGYQVLLTTENYMRSRDIALAFRRHTRYAMIMQNIKPFLLHPPVDFPRDDYVRAHFMICYLVIMMITLIQFDSEFKLTAAEICREASNLNCVNIKENLYFLIYWSDTIEKLCNTYGVEFSRDPMTLAEIRHQIAKVK
jgi:hypothetical protein